MAVMVVANRRVLIVASFGNAAQEPQVASPVENLNANSLAVPTNSEFSKLVVQLFALF